MVLKTIETIETIFKLAGETKPQEKNKAQEKNNQRIVPIVFIVFKKNAKSRDKNHRYCLFKNRQERELRNNSLLNESDVSRVVFKDSLSELFVAYVRVDEGGGHLLVP